MTNPFAPWMDATYRTPGEPEILNQPDGTVEMSWGTPGPAGTSRLTLLLDPDQFRSIIEKGRDMIATGQVRSSVRRSELLRAKPSE